MIYRVEHEAKDQRLSFDSHLEFRKLRAGPIREKLKARAEERPLRRRRRIRQEPRGLYSLVATCESRGINPFDYLADVLSRVQEYPMKAMPELLQGAWAPCLSARLTAMLAGRLRCDEMGGDRRLQRQRKGSYSVLREHAREHVAKGRTICAHGEKLNARSYLHRDGPRRSATYFVCAIRPRREWRRRQDRRG